MMASTNAQMAQLMREVERLCDFFPGVVYKVEKREIGGSGGIHEPKQIRVLELDSMTSGMTWSDLINSAIQECDEEDLKRRGANAVGRLLAPELQTLNSSKRAETALESCIPRP